MGTIVHNIELKPGKGGQLGRSAGAEIQIMAKEGNYAQLRLPSGEMRLVPLACYATIRAGRQSGSRECGCGQGRAQPVAGQTTLCERGGNEPGRTTRTGEEREKPREEDIP